MSIEVKRHSSTSSMGRGSEMECDEEDGNGKCRTLFLSQADAFVM